MIRKKWSFPKRSWHDSRAENLEIKYIPVSLTWISLHIKLCERSFSDMYRFLFAPTTPRVLQLIELEWLLSNFVYEILTTSDWCVQHIVFYKCVFGVIKTRCFIYLRFSYKVRLSFRLIQSVHHETPWVFLYT